MLALFDSLKPHQILETSLTGAYDYGSIEAKDVETRLDEPLAIRAFKVFTCMEEEGTSSDAPRDLYSNRSAIVTTR